MGHNDLILFLLQIGVMVAVALLFGKLMHRFNQPIILGELIGGIILGPTIFGALTPTTFDWLFPATGATVVARESVLKLGMLFFLFAAGLEVNLSHLGQRGWCIVLTSVLGVVLPFCVGFFSVLYFPDLWSFNGKIGSMMFALLIGTSLSISALPVIVRILADLNLLRKELGLIILSSATINDLIGWSLFSALLSSFVQYGVLTKGFGISFTAAIAFSVLIVSLGRWAGQPLLNWLQSHLNWPGSYIGVMTVLMIVVAALAETLGIHTFFAAFLVGVALASHSGEPKEEHTVMYRFAISFFAPIYFVSIGLKADFAASFDLPLILFILIIASLGKIIGASLGAWLGGMPRREGLAVGFGMNARGMMEIVFASVALEYHLIDQRIYVALIVMALVTSMISGPVMKRIILRET